MAAPNKDTIYIDIDDEITGIIDKLKASEGKVVALVLPKRASVFQSIVNMKLLKRAADGSKKHLVLITSEAGLLPLAGAAGVHVAKTLTSKPEIPSAPEPDTSEATVEESAEDAGEIDPNQPIGKLAGPATGADGVETLVLDDEDVPPELDDAPTGPKTFEPPKGKKNKKLAVPNFERFRLFLILGGVGLLLLIFGFVFANMSLAKAKITVKTDATNVDVNLQLVLATAATESKIEEGVLPAKLASQQKVYTQQVPTTGQKNTGNKASGDVTITNCNKDGSGITIPAGTGVSANGQTYITQSTVEIEESLFQGSNCRTFPSTSASVNVIAQSAGKSFDLTAGSDMKVAGYPNTTAKSGGITGGTDNIVQSVNQNDINNAKAKIVPNDAEMKQLLTDQLQKEKYYAIAVTYLPGTPAVTTSANVGDAVSSVTVTQTITYTMFGVRQADLKQVIEADIKGQIDAEKQSILDNGLSKAVFTLDSQTPADAHLTLTAVGVAGPDLDVASIKALAAGKKPGVVKQEISNNPDVTDVTIDLSPFWVSSIPKKTDRITVEIAKPADSAKADSSDGGSR